MGNIKKDELESKLLSLLDSSTELRDKIRSICSAAGSTAQQQEAAAPSNRGRGAVFGPGSGIFDTRRISYLETKVQQLERDLAQARNAYAKASADLEERNSSYARLQSQYNELEKDRDELEKARDGLVKERDQLIQDKHNLMEEASELTERIERSEAEIERLNETVREMKGHFSGPAALYERYKNISKAVRTGLSNVICDKDEILFIASCSHPDNLKSIWIYAKTHAANGGAEEETEVLKDIFDYFFDVFNRSLSEPRFERDSVEKGYLFDGDKYDRAPGSSTSGRITQVVFRGYRSANTGTVICRSVVRV